MCGGDGSHFDNNDAVGEPMNMGIKRTQDVISSNNPSGMGSGGSGILLGQSDSTGGMVERSGG